MANEDCDDLPAGWRVDWTSESRETVCVSQWPLALNLPVRYLPTLIARLQELADETQTLEPGTDGDGT